ncbi:MAG: hypothetical protein Q4A00_07230 [Flavobacteriaceae bacterium]|nr:hypothetical protein [Flavobacteriaceae bacterium]
MVENKEEKPKVILSKFNPNELSAGAWQDLGFTENQVKTILKYKEILGGQFVSKEQLAKCYAISEEKFAELDPYILLPNKGNEFQKSQLKVVKELNIKGKFNPNDYGVQDWVNMGFSQKQSEAIVKYKNYLGGKFESKEKFRECFVISDENYQKLAPYLLLPERVLIQNLAKEDRKPKIEYTYFDPNLLDLDGWQKLGFSEKQAWVILNYKEKNLKGSFKNLEDVQRCFVISDEKFSELKPWIKIAPQVPKTEEAKVEIAKTDFSKIDLNEISYRQLVEFGFTEKSARSFVNFRKLLGGFAEKSQVLETYYIDKDLAKKLLEISPLNNSKIQKYTLKDAPEDFLKRHPYFRKFADKIIFYRVSFPSDKEIFSKINATSEEITKMKWYLK